MLKTRNLKVIPIWIKLSLWVSGQCKFFKILDKFEFELGYCGMDNVQDYKFKTEA